MVVDSLLGCCILLVFCISRPVACVNQKESWYIKYGADGYGRPLNEGYFHEDEVTAIQCSMGCAKTDNCKALQVILSNGDASKEGACYLFDSVTHHSSMPAMSNAFYYEERICANPVIADAIIFFPVIDQGLVLHGQTVYGIYINPQMKWDLPWNIDIGYVFPALVGPIEAMFMGPDTEDIVYVIKGGVDYCYENPSPGYLDYFNSCQISKPTNVLQPFLLAHPGPIDGAVTLGNDHRELHVLQNDVIYRLQWNVGTKQFDTIESFFKNDTSKMWSGLPSDVSSIARTSKADLQLVVEGWRLMEYNTTTKQVTKAFFFCV